MKNTIKFRPCQTLIQSFEILLFISISKTFLLDLLPAGSLLFHGNSPAKFINSCMNDGRFIRVARRNIW